jgi:hypothetical protein
MISELRFDYPSWLKKDRLEQAEALLKLGFHYVPDVEFISDEESLILKVSEWGIYATCCDAGILAVCDGASYFWDMSDIPNINNRKCLETVVSTVRKSIRRMIKLQKERVGREFRQLSLL